ARTLEYGPIALDAQRHLVTVEGAEVKLTAKEFLLLQYLMEHRGRLVSRDVLLRDVWGYQFTGGTRTVDVHVRRLREKIGLLAGAITTIKQVGYPLHKPPGGARASRATTSLPAPAPPPGAASSAPAPL